ncbi:MAG: DNA polymerase IV [Pseudomonadota bacterium]|nr:DNA polymerase IV [Pseudomonadota bacterium]
MTEFSTSCWSRIIMHVDMNAFFASIEQNDFIDLRNKPIAVTNGIKGSCVITCSYEARAFGVRTGMKFKDAKLLCPKLIRRTSRPKRYIEISKGIMKILGNISPDLEIFSVDEAFLDLTYCQKIYPSPIFVAKLVKKNISNKFNLSCSIGISDNKAIAKFAAKLNKPDGLTIINPWEAEKTLSNYSVTELCGVSYGIQKFLNLHGVFLCGDMKKIPISILGDRFGNIGRKIWLMAQGKDIDKVNSKINQPKSFGHGKVTKPNTYDRDEIKKIFHYMSEKVARRMRLYKYESNLFFVGLKTTKGWFGNKIRIEHYLSHGKDIFNICMKLIREFNFRHGIFQVQVTALKPRPINMQQDLFFGSSNRNKALDLAMDKINERFGEFTIARARIINKLENPDVISPSWRPEGHRKSI